ncbi:hypothetical protein DFH09DRAFT_1097768 [Mycena vulgaris]|nr:hypothetical protein DFH09DRAFT_1097768 [Mycena vulgaris]
MSAGAPSIQFRRRSWFGESRGGLRGLICWCQPVLAGGEEPLTDETSPPSELPDRARDGPSPQPSPSSNPDSAIVLNRAQRTPHAPTTLLAYRFWPPPQWQQMTGSRRGGLARGLGWLAGWNWPRRAKLEPTTLILIAHRFFASHKYNGTRRFPDSAPHSPDQGLNLPVSYWSNAPMRQIISAGLLIQPFDRVSVVATATAVLRCEMMMFREGGGGETGAGRETECVNPPSRGFRGGFNVDKSWSYGDGVARKRTIPADRERQSPRIRHIESLCQQIRRDLVSKPRCNSRFRQDSLTDQQDLGCGLIGSCFRARTRPNMDESSRVLSVSVLYPAGARWLSLRGQSVRIQASLRAYPGGFPWVEPVSCEVQTVGGIQDVWGVRALELDEIPREEVAGGAVGVVRGGFPQGGAQ